MAAEDNVGKVKQKLEETNYTASLKTLMEASGCKRTSVQKMVKNQLQLKSLTKEKMRRVTSTHAERRLAACVQWKKQMDSGYELDPRKIFFAGEKVFCLGVSPGGNQNCRVWVQEGTKKRDVPVDVIRRGEGERQGGARVMVCLGMSWRGIGAPRFLAQGHRLNSTEYLDVLENTYLMDIADTFKGEDYIFMQDGAPAHTSVATQKWCQANLSKFWDKKS